MTRALVVLVVVLGCGGDPLPLNIRDAAIDARVLGLCSVCVNSTDCASGICRMYGDGYRKCTLACEAGQLASACTGPLTTGACNGMGYCMCDSVPPSDAGVDDGGYRDAAIIVPEDAPVDAF